ncbi:hypothetical protein FPFC_010210 [Fructobacillus pseudoficulneus]|uniref:DNA-directed RNA polymerase beta subunit n=1 Tax=Fructobacillus pseudoficulneus TaxID=220714 RepID=A0A3F3H6D4_9LACO|nr:hypothetical protein [Fructobacillus pseudoficulneus]GAP02143.1 hypothetical protein FPFC_010210 [Fructobacillus pseudoficulneus]SEH35879.1 hypothetical protein SAMN05660469_0094 [Fructobacillus pseudoficulneus]
MNNSFASEKDWLKTVSTYFAQDYRDRGKVKWNGFFLSDHTAKLSEQKKDQKVLEKASWQPQMAYHDIQRVVGQAAANQQELSVQLNQQDQDGHVSPIITGRVTGFFESGFYLDQVAKLWDEIRFVEVQHGKH